MRFYDRMAQKFSTSPAFLRVMLGTIKLMFKVITKTRVRNWSSWVDGDKSFSTILPINEELRADNVLVPNQIVSEFIEKSSHRMIMNGCGCRMGYNCQNHPHDIGCL